MKWTSIFLFLVSLLACDDTTNLAISPAGQEHPGSVELIVLGNVQDAGSPHIACRKECCRELFLKPDPSRQVTALGLVDRANEKSYLFEASPDLPGQAKRLAKFANSNEELPQGIFL
ncbi:MAG: pyrroloquinoline quinone biosynthesis protein PqqB, partial [Bacteroidota bacterium]